MGYEKLTMTIIIHAVYTGGAIIHHWISESEKTIFLVPRGERLSVTVIFSGDRFCSGLDQ